MNDVNEIKAEIEMLSGLGAGSLYEAAQARAEADEQNQLWNGRDNNLVKHLVAAIEVEYYKDKIPQGKAEKLARASDDYKEVLIKAAGFLKKAKAAANKQNQKHARLEALKALLIAELSLAKIK